jgi:HD domain
LLTFRKADPYVEIVVAAALLHDAIEDQPQKAPRASILAVCGKAVLDLVEECTECGVEGQEKAPWRERKQNYLDHVQSLSMDALLISVCDKLQSARELLRQVRRDYQAYEPFRKEDESLGQCKDRVLWFQRELVRAFERRIEDAFEDSPEGIPIIGAISAYIDEFAAIVDELS